MQIIIAGDLVPTQSNIELFINSNVSALVGDEFLSIWNTTDFRIFNLESPLTDNKDPLHKSGPNLVSSTKSINGIKAFNPTVVGLANNHILDQGATGLKSTIDILKQKDISFVGAGYSLSEAVKPYIIQKNGLKIGIYACAEHEFSIASEKTPGANPFDPLESLDHIQKLNEECDYVIVLYHGGRECYRYPSPMLQKVCRKIAEKGANLVICQHSHCIGCYENHKDSVIVYGQGNFIFDGLDNEYWKTSLLVVVNIDESMDIQFIPFIKCGNCIRLADDNMAGNILDDFNKRSVQILEPDYILEQYSEFALKNLPYYLQYFSGSSKFISKIDNKLFKSKLIRCRYNKKRLLYIQNSIRCEAHNELIITGIEAQDKKANLK